MTPADFRRLALALPGTEAGSHQGREDFRVDGRIFATLAHAAQGYGNLMLTPEQQAGLLADAPTLFLPVAGGWGRQGATHIRLGSADQATLESVLRLAWKLRLEKNSKKSPRRKAETLDPRQVAAREIHRAAPAKTPGSPTC